jgi:DNA-binding NtrC family response regulator
MASRPKPPAAASDDPRRFLVFVVEDDPFYAKLIAKALELYEDMTVRVHGTAKSLLDHLHEGPRLITLDYRLPDGEGLDLLAKIRARRPETDVVVISEQNKVETAVELLRQGAVDYLVKERDLRERLLRVVDHIRRRQQLEGRVADLQAEVQERFAFRSALIGESAGLQPVFKLMEKAAQSDINVVVTGETGTGKEVVAKAIHYHSPRAEGPFVAVNMAAIPRELVESEFFGHEKGAFTGADARRIGHFEAANGGTLFLDEIGETDPAFQPKLLRALQEREVLRVGGREKVSFDIRVIVATHRDLQAMVAEQKFRSDLYYRLIGIPIVLPPLRERGDDVVLLARHFADQYAQERELPVPKLAPSAVNALKAHAWPGNVRELRAVVELAVVMAAGGAIEAEDLQLGGQDLVAREVARERTLKEYTERIIHHFLERYDGKVKAVAERLDIHPSTIYRMLKEQEDRD